MPPGPRERSVAAGLCPRVGRARQAPRFRRRRGRGDEAAPGLPRTPAHGRSGTWFVSRVSPPLPRPRRRRNLGAWRALPTRGQRPAATERSRGPGGIQPLIATALGPVPAWAQPARRRCSVTRTTSVIGPLPARVVVLGWIRSSCPRRRRNIGAARALPTACTRRAATGLPRGHAGTSGTVLQRH
jgi:hypothetical protein